MYIDPEENTTIRDGASCSREIFLGNPILLRAGLNVIDFVAENFKSFFSIDYGYINSSTNVGKVGKLGAQVLQVGFAPGTTCCRSNVKLSTLLANEGLLFEDRDYVEYTEVEIGYQDDDELQRSIEDVSKRTL